MSHGLGLAALFGAALTLLIELRGRGMLVALVGNANAAAVVPAAMKYSAIRGAGTIFALMGSVARAASLAAQDPRAPLIAVGLLSPGIDAPEPSIFL